MAGTTAAPYSLTGEHDAIRAAVRDIAEREIKPFAAEVDAESRYPIEAQKALTSAGFHATHIPEAYGGEGADAIATCIVIEEVARVDVSASLIPAVNKLGSMPILLSASEDLKQRVLPSIAEGRAMISYGLSEREAGSDAAAMRTRARREGDSWVLNGTKAWITNSGISEWYTVMAVTDPEKRANGISAF
uniref:acyl-CoA dehydrogenase family protein n=1 Tax=Blastococcus sp. URHD0036 TaxID=1380356 RepID=UPI00054F7201